jgi:hypothetical protein
LPVREWRLAESFLIYVQQILLSQLLCNELEIQFSLPKRPFDLGMKHPEENNSCIVMKLGMTMTRTRKFFSCIMCGKNSRSISPASGDIFTAECISE